MLFPLLQIFTNNDRKHFEEQDACIYVKHTVIFLFKISKIIINDEKNKCVFLESIVGFEISNFIREYFIFFKFSSLLPLTLFKIVKKISSLWTKSSERLSGFHLKTHLQQTL